MNPGNCRNKKRKKRRRRNPRFCTEQAIASGLMCEWDSDLFPCSTAREALWSLRLMSLYTKCYNCGGFDHHAKECILPPQPKKCHYCQSIMHMVANCPLKTVPQQPTSYQGRYEAESQPSTSAFLREGGGGAYGCTSPSYSQEGRPDVLQHSGKSPQEAASSKFSPSPEEQSQKGPSVQKRKKT